MIWQKHIEEMIPKCNGDYKDVAAECSDWLSQNVTGLDPVAYEGHTSPRAWWDWWTRIFMEDVWTEY